MNIMKETVSYVFMSWIVSSLFGEATSFNLNRKFKRLVRYVFNRVALIMATQTDFFDISKNWSSSYTQVLPIHWDFRSLTNIKSLNWFKWLLWVLDWFHGVSSTELSASVCVLQTHRRSIFILFFNLQQIALFESKETRRCQCTSLSGNVSSTDMIHVKLNFYNCTFDRQHRSITWEVLSFPLQSFVLSFFFTFAIWLCLKRRTVVASGCLTGWWAYLWLLHWKKALHWSEVTVKVA